MNTITVAIEDVKVQLIGVVRSALDSGFELIAEAAAAKMAGAMKEAVKAAQEVAAAAAADRDKKEAAAAVQVADIAGLRAQILDNAAILLPLMTHRSRTHTHTRTRTRTNTAAPIPIPVCDHDPFDPANTTDNGIRIATMGARSTGIRAMLFGLTAANPRANRDNCRCWSLEHATLPAALKDLLEVTESLLVVYLSPRLATKKSPKTSSGEFWAQAAERAPEKAKVDEDATPKAEAEGLGIYSEKGKLFWDASMTTNPHFKGFDYKSFDSGFASNEPKGGERAAEKKNAW